MCSGGLQAAGRAKARPYTLAASKFVSAVFMASNFTGLRNISSASNARDAASIGASVV